MLDLILLDISFFNGPPLLLLLTFNMVIFMPKDLDEEGNEMSPAGMYPI